MILHCKNAEMTIFYLFFLNLAVFYIGENKKSQK